MKQEVEAHTRNEVWELLKKSQDHAISLVNEEEEED
jgi:hypothetical protein